jgi:hypothetical protein
VSIMALAREHLAGDHARLPARSCGLCPACPACGGRGAVMAVETCQGKNYMRADGCSSCSGTGSQKGDKR